MKKLLLFFFALLLSLSVSAQETSQLTKEEAIELAKQECIRSGISSDWFGGNVMANFNEDKGWFVTFEEKENEATDIKRLGNHLLAFITHDGQVVCLRGM